MDIKNLLSCNDFQFLISELKSRNINIIEMKNNKNENVYIEIFKNHLKQHQYVLHGFSCALPTEDKSVEWLLSLLANNSENLKYICARDGFNKATADEIVEEYPLGEEPDEDDDPDTGEILGYPETSIVGFIIELDIIKNHPKKLADYFKRLQIPRAAKFASDIKKLHENTFG